MQPIKTLLAALMLSGSAAALAADNSVSIAVESTVAPTTLSAQSWPAPRGVEHAWPQWMHTLTGTVLALDEERPQVLTCTTQQCAQRSGMIPTGAAHADNDTQASYVRHANLQRLTELGGQLPQRLSF